ncbi:MAG: TRAP transporter substrate-binding protein DctP [Myxococcota bacterium]
MNRSKVMNRIMPCVAAASLALVLGAPAPAFAKKKIKIKLGTLAPEGSAWYDGVRRIGDRWKKASKGAIRFKIYAGGVVGDESDFIRKMNIGQLQAASITGIGLQRLTPAAMAWQIPMAIQSYEELDYIREKMAPVVEAELEKAGFIVLNWGDAGWVHMFSKVPAKTPQDFAALKLYTWSEDPDSEAAWKAAGFNPVPLSATEVLASLQSGLVDWYVTTPLFALSSQWFGLAPNMVEVKWSPLNGATVMTKKAYDKLPADIREELMSIAKEEGERTKVEVRGLDKKAIKAMVDRGLKVTPATPELVEMWRKRTEASYVNIRGKVVPEKYFDEVMRLTKEFRSRGK